MIVVVSCIWSFAQEPAKNVKEQDDPPRTAFVGYRKWKFSYESSTGEKRERDVSCWYPSADRDALFRYGGQIGFANKDAPVRNGKHAVILFSHGHLSFGEQSIFLTEGLARAGYIVLAPTHADNFKLIGSKDYVDPKFFEVKSWDDAKHFDRAEDFHFLLNSVLSGSSEETLFLKGMADPAKIGGVGHSLGGYTMACLSGAREKWREKRLKAACLYSPYLLPLLEGKLKEVEVPVHMQGGTLDFPLTPLLSNAFAQLPLPKYLLVLKGETHFGWSNLNAFGKNTIIAGDSGNAKFMLDYTLAFLNEHVREERPSGLLTEKNPALDSIRWETK